jgi:hypothetical protein
MFAKVQVELDFSGHRPSCHHHACTQDQGQPVRAICVVTLWLRANEREFLIGPGELR